MRCDNCNRLIRPEDIRAVSVSATWGEPGYEEYGCVHCAPSDDDEARARNADDERRFDEMREAI